MIGSQDFKLKEFFKILNPAEIIEFIELNAIYALNLPTIQLKTNNKYEKQLICLLMYAYHEQPKKP